MFNQKSRIAFGLDIATTVLKGKQHFMALKEAEPLTTFDTLAQWVEQARAKLENGDLKAEDLEALLYSVRQRSTTQRQRLLYLHATTPSPRARVIGMALHEPVRGSMTQITTEKNEWPYRTVHDALVDGWHIIHFPDQRAPFDDREIDVLGYEFILHKREEYYDE